jgi:hypothetical protein
MKPQGYYNIISGAVILALAAALFFCGKECNRRPVSCPEIKYRDTVRIPQADISYHDFVSNPKLVEVRKTAESKKGATSPIPVNAPRATEDSSQWIVFEGGEVSPIQIADTTHYTDSVYHSAHFKAVINDLITGNKIVHRDIQWADLTPETQITNTVSVVKKEYWFKLYLGGQIGGNAHKLDGGPAAMSVHLSNCHFINNK